MNSQFERYILPEDEQKNACVVEDYIKIEDEYGGYGYTAIASTLISFLSIDFCKFERIIVECDGYKYFDEVFYGFLDQHPYLKLFQVDIDTENIEDCYNYYDYLVFLQVKFQALFDFCFRTDLTFSELAGLTATQRLHVFDSINYSNIPQELKQIKSLDGDALGMFSVDENAVASPLEAMCNIPAGFINFIKDYNVKMIPTYMLSSTFDALTLEFYQMIDMDIKIKKCKHCGQYFEVRTKRNPDYCDRVFGDGTQTCQQIMASKAFKEKTKDNEPYKIFNLYYKRYHVRKKVGTIKADVFDKWNREACTKRDLCLDGKGDVGEFEQWCYDSFPNRKRKD